MKIQDAASLRDKAITAARKRVQQNGFTSLRLSEVARDLNVSHAALYKYFADKQDLLDAINAQWMDEINTKLHSICDKNDEACSKIKQWFLLLYTMRRDKVLRSAGEYALYVSTEELQRPCAMQDALVRKAQLAGLVEDAMRSGKIARANVDEVTTLLFHASDHFIHPAVLAYHANQDKTKEFAEILDVVLAGLALAKVHLQKSSLA